MERLVYLQGVQLGRPNGSTGNEKKFLAITKTQQILKLLDKGSIIG